MPVAGVSDQEQNCQEIYRGRKVSVRETDPTRKKKERYVRRH
jgi:hypothetical protein